MSQQSPVLFRSIVGKLLSTESESNPKVMLGRIVASVFPDRALQPLKKAYYYYLLKHYFAECLERDAFVVKHLVSPGDHVADIGASIGSYTKFLSERVGPKGRVYSFEPIPATFDILKSNVQKFCLSNVVLHACAISDSEGPATMVIPRYRWGSECWYDARFQVGPNNALLRHIHVAKKTLDSFFPDEDARLSVIKIDANYHELACFRGGLRTLRHSKPAIIVEIQPNPDDQSTTAFATFVLLQELGYKAYWFDGSELRVRHTGQRSQNYFFLMPEHLRALQKQSTIKLRVD